MKTLLLVVLMFTSSQQFGKLVRAEKMTPDEITELRAAEAQVSEAQQKLGQVQLKIANAHGMKGESWMEWQSYAEIDGDFIVMRYHNSMNGIKW